MSAKKKKSCGFGETGGGNVGGTVCKEKQDVTCDNYFTDFDMAQSLRSDDLTIVGKNKTFIPPEFLLRKSHPQQSSIFAGS
jgi:hypothetical protein